MTSEFILAEVNDKLIERFRFTEERAAEVDALLRSRMETVVPTGLATSVCRDPDDDNIPATAAAGNCECIVTGDKDLLVLKRFGSIIIISPSEFPSYESTE